MMTMGQTIGQRRRALNMTQEALANILGVSNQAVSKWESDQCYPDIELLPKLADQFGITIDQLFGREPEQIAPVEAKYVEGLPWPDDNTLRAVVYKGRKLLANMRACRDMTFTFCGEPVNVESAFNLRCEAVGGNVSAGGSVTCGDVAGDVEAAGSVNCNRVEGDVECGSCATIQGSVEGSVEAGATVTCGDVGGDVEAGASVTCGDVGGGVEAGGKVTCQSMRMDWD